MKTKKKLVMAKTIKKLPANVLNGDRKNFRGCKLSKPITYGGNRTAFGANTDRHKLEIKSTARRNGTSAAYVKDKG
jgi:hypothetical protein